MKIDNLVKNLEKNTSEQDKAMQKQVRSVTERHLTSYNELLELSRSETKKALAGNIKLIKENRGDIQKALAYKTLLWALMGGLIVIIIILIGCNLWLGLSLNDKRAELAEITQNIEHTPLQAKALARVEIMEDKGIIYIANKKERKAETYQNSDKQQILKIK